MELTKQEGQDETKHTLSCSFTALQVWYFSLQVPKTSDHSNLMEGKLPFGQHSKKPLPPDWQYKVLSCNQGPANRILGENDARIKANDQPLQVDKYTFWDYSLWI